MNTSMQLFFIDVYMLKLSKSGVVSFCGTHSQAKLKSPTHCSVSDQHCLMLGQLNYRYLFEVLLVPSIA